MMAAVQSSRMTEKEGIIMLESERTNDWGRCLISLSRLIVHTVLRSRRIGYSFQDVTGFDVTIRPSVD